MNDVVFIKGQGGLGRPLPGEDHICGLMTFGNVLPAGFPDNLSKQYLSLAQAEADGIVQGDANFGTLWYHISEFFRLNPKGILWVKIAAVPAVYDFTEIISLQQLADGKIRKMGVWTHIVAFSIAHVTALKAVKATLDTQHMPLDIIYAPEISGTIDLSTLPDLSGSDSDGVGVLIAQDGSLAGKALFDDTGKTVSCIGAAMGAWSFAKVNESIAWVQKFPMASGVGELDVPAFSNGQLFKEVDPAIVEQLNTYRYIFLRKFVGLSQTFFNDDHCATALTSDYAYLDDNTTINKAIRQVRVALLPQLNGPVQVDAVSGQLSNDYVEFLKALGDEALAQMARDGEISGYQTIIDPTQNVLGTGNVQVSIENVPVGVSRNFTITIGNVLKLSN